MMDKLISIIVPVYNVENYLKRCVDSLINQTYKNLQIILVDDGSKDNCPFICDEYAKTDSRITVIHKKNEGVSAARNRGLDIAEGDYIGFVDSDDYIHPKMYEFLMRAIKENDADLSLVWYDPVYEAENYNNLINSSQEYRVGRVYDNNEDVVMSLYNKEFRINVGPWNKLYKKSIFKSLRYPTDKIRGEDESVIHIILSLCNKAVVLENKMYYYFQRKGSVMNSNNPQIYIDQINALKERIIFFINNNYNNALNMAVKQYYKYTCFVLFKVFTGDIKNIRAKDILDINKEVYNMTGVNKYKKYNYFWGCILGKVLDKFRSR